MKDKGSPPSEHGGRGVPRLWRYGIFLPVAFGVLAADLASKHLIFAAAGARLRNGAIAGAEVIEVIPGFFELQCVMNPGAFSGWFGGWFWFLIVVSVVALAAIAAYLAWGTITSRLFVLSLSFIAAGTAGNLYDRWAYGAVRDFFHFYIPREGGRNLSWPNFNVADMSICVGVGLWILLELRAGKRRGSG